MDPLTRVKKLSSMGMEEEVDPSKANLNITVIEDQGAFVERGLARETRTQEIKKPEYITQYLKNLRLIVIFPDGSKYINYNPRAESGVLEARKFYPYEINGLALPPMSFSFENEDLNSSFARKLHEVRFSGFNLLLPDDQSRLQEIKGMFIHEKGSEQSP